MSRIKLLKIIKREMINSIRDAYLGAEKTINITIASKL